MSRPRKRVMVSCRTCGKSFETFPSHAPRRIFCSHKCKHPNRDEERWEASIDRTSYCWNWIATIQDNGYGRFTPHATHRARLAHRMAYENWVGPIPDGLTIDHECRNRRCVNPWHLRLMTRGDNVRSALLGKTWAEIRQPKDTVIHVRRSA